jgi:YHS domain-containing protein
MTTSNAEHNFIDPVCQMKVTKGSKVPSFVYQSETYHFCADSCRKAFMADPRKYLVSRSNKRKGFWGRYLDRLNKSTGGKPPCCH